MGLSFLISCALELIDLLLVTACLFSERLSSLYMNAVTLGPLENNPDNSTSQKGKPLNRCNSEFARDPSSNDVIHARKQPLNFTRNL